MKEVTIKTYQFHELSEAAKQKAIQDNISINVDFQWWDHVYCDAKSIGLKIDSFDLDRNKHANGTFHLSALEVAQNILNDHGPDCETYKTAQSFLDKHAPLFSDYFDEDSENYESTDIDQELTKLEDEFLNSILFDYANMLQLEFEHLCSDEVIKETIEANEYNFLECGEMFNL